MIKEKKYRRMDRGANSKYWVAIPSKDDTSTTSTYHTLKDGTVKEYKYQDQIFASRYDYFKLSDDIYESKEYPTCKCGRKYVPIRTSRGFTRYCYFCRNK